MSGSHAAALYIAGVLMALAGLFAGGYWLYTHLVGKLLFQAQSASILPPSLVLGLAVLGGAASFFSPCSLVITPSFLVYFVEEKPETGAASGGNRLLTASLLIAAGIIGFYAAAAVLVSTIGAIVYNILVYLIPVVGAAFVLMGAMMLFGRGASLAWAARYLPGHGYYQRLLDNHERKNNYELAGFGVAYGAASHSCTLPVFLGVVMLPLAAGNYWLASLAVLLYGIALAGLMLLMLTLGQPAVISVRRWTGPYLHYLIGGLFLATGGYLFHYFMTNFGFSFAS